MREGCTDPSFGFGDDRGALVGLQPGRSPSLPPDVIRGDLIRGGFSLIHWLNAVFGAWDVGKAADMLQIAVIGAGLPRSRSEELVAARQGTEGVARYGDIEERIGEKETRGVPGAHIAHLPVIDPRGHCHLAVQKYR